MKKKTLFMLLAALALMSALVLSSCNGGTVSDDETTVPETTVDLSAIIGVTRSLTRDELGGCTPFTAESAAPSVVEARVMDREIQLTATGAGTAAVKVKNTYGEDFEITVTCDPSGTISFEGEYKPVENSVNVKDFISSGKMSTTEAIQAAIDSLKQGRTIISIAHRLSTLRDADMLCVIENGELKETGTHDRLIRAKGKYYELYKLQSEALQFIQE